MDDRLRSHIIDGSLALLIETAVLPHQKGGVSDNPDSRVPTPIALWSTVPHLTTSLPLLMVHSLIRLTLDDADSLPPERAHTRLRGRHPTALKLSDRNTSPMPLPRDH